MNDDYVGLTIRREVLKKDGLTLDIAKLKEIAVAAMKYYYRYYKQASPKIEVRRCFPEHLGIEEYDVRPADKLRIRLSLEAENYAPFNCWMEAERPNSAEWQFITDLAAHLSKRFPELPFGAASSFCRNPECAEAEKYTNLSKNGQVVARLTRQEWIEKYLGLQFPYGQGPCPTCTHQPET